MARNVVATTARATTKAARATAAGATRTTMTAATVATMTPKGGGETMVLLLRRGYTTTNY